MLSLKYIFHSGFAIESESAILVFDYWMDPADVMPSVLCSGKPLYVFASHFHEDHFVRDIFGWRSASCVTYVLSKDILRHRRASRDEVDVWMGKGAQWTDGVVEVWATGSTDVGVSWVVKVDGKTIFHAGDLNNWYARFLGEADVPAVVRSPEFGIDVSPLAEEKRYLGELKDVAKIATHFDVAMFPVDARIGNGFTRGARQFVERFTVGLFVPMHFSWNDIETVSRMKPYCDERDIAFWSISGVGDTYCLDC